MSAPFRTTWELRYTIETLWGEVFADTGESSGLSDSARKELQERVVQEVLDADNKRILEILKMSQ